MVRDSKTSQGINERSDGSAEMDGNRWWFGSAKPELKALETEYSSSSLTEMANREFTWYEFFAGGGMARLGLGAKWKCIFANEWCKKKASAYRGYFGPSKELKVADVAELTLDDLPGTPDLVWASFPCQDLSLAGSGAGLRGERSGTFKFFWRLVEGMINDGRAPALVVLENVSGTLTSHSGADFMSIVNGFSESGYRVGALVIDAVRFLPHSRPRLFVVGIHAELDIPLRLQSAGPMEPWHPRTLVRAERQLPAHLHKNWIWWNLPIPRVSVPTLASLIELRPTGVAWHSELETRKVLALMSPTHRKRVSAVMKLGARHVGTIYKRTRPDEHGKMSQRAEVRFDGISGCLRTPVGGSSRQTVLVAENGKARTRLLSPREAARLMGVSDAYPMPGSYNEGYHVFGDGVAVPVVGWLEKHLLRPLAMCKKLERVA